MKKILFFMVAMATICMGFASCDEEETKDVIKKATIVGYWQYESSTDTSSTNFFENYDVYYDFKANDSLYNYVLSGDTLMMMLPATYSIKGDTLYTMTGEGEDNLTKNVIVDLSLNKMTLAPETEPDEDPYTVTFKRVAILPTWKATME